jgi:formylglycine-generating enzyme required for sulfatase activity
LYPWGDTFIAENTYWGQDRGLAGIKPVESYPGDRSPVGAMDMGGNTDEWVLDGFALTPTCSDRVCVDPVAVFSPDKLCVRVGQDPCGLTRGGWLRSKSASNRDLAYLQFSTGFRCVRTCPADCEPPR